MCGIYVYYTFLLTLFTGIKYEARHLRIPYLSSHPIHRYIKFCAAFAYTPPFSHPILTERQTDRLKVKHIFNSVVSLTPKLGFEDEKVTAFKINQLNHL